MAYTKQLIFSLFHYFGSFEMSDSSDPPSTCLFLDLSADTGFFLVAWLLTKPLPDFGNFVVSKDTSSVVIVSSQIITYVSC
jgi:hypothetical protein